MALAQQPRGRRSYALPARATGDLCRVHLTWEDPGRQAATYFVHGQPHHLSVPHRMRPTSLNLLGQIGEPVFVHSGLHPAGEAWDYLVVAVDDRGEVCATSEVVGAVSSVSVSVSGRPVATVGSLDGRANGRALARFGYVRYQSTFPADVDFTHGRDEPSTAWSWLQPGPDDAWAGRRTHRFRLRFDLDHAPREDLDLAVWLADRHPTRAATAGLSINGERLEPLLFVDQTDGAGAADQVAPGHGAGPAYLERAVPATALRPGENVLEIVKDQGSWIAYDALGLFARPTLPLVE